MKKPERECKRWMAGYDRGGMPSGSPLINSTGGDIMQRRYRKRYNREYGARIKMEALNKAGGAECACCGDRHVEFLVVDHKDSDGGSWRRMGTGSDFYRWLKRSNYPDMG